MMNDKLKKMYVSGGLLGALLKDPEQRKMAEEMLQKAEGGMSVKPYRSGGMMYQNGGQNDVDPPKTAARDAFSAFQKEIEKKYPAPDAKVSLEDATQFLRLQRAADRELSAEVGNRRFEREKEIDALDRRSAVVSNRFGDSEQRRSQNKMMADEAAQRQYFTQEVQGRSFPPGAMMPKTEMERAQRLEMLKGIQQVKDDKEFEEYLKANEFEGFTPYDLQFVEGSDSYVEQPERFSPDALRRILKYRPINYYDKGGNMPGEDEVGFKEESVDFFSGEKMPDYGVTEKSIAYRKENIMEANEMLDKLSNAYRGLSAENRRGKVGSDLKYLMNLMKDQKRGVAKDYESIYQKPSGEFYKSNVTPKMIDDYLARL